MATRILPRDAESGVRRANTWGPSLPMLSTAMASVPPLPPDCIGTIATSPRPATSP